MGWKTKTKKGRANRVRLYSKKIRELQKKINSMLKHPEWPEDNQEFEPYNNKNNKNNKNNNFVYAELNNNPPNRRSLAEARLSHNNKVRSLSPKPIYEIPVHTLYGTPIPRNNLYSKSVSHYGKPIIQNNHYNTPNSHLTTNKNNLPPLPRPRKRNNKTNNNNLPPLPRPRKRNNKTNNNNLPPLPRPRKL